MKLLLICNNCGYVHRNVEPLLQCFCGKHDYSMHPENQDYSDEQFINDLCTTSTTPQAPSPESPTTLLDMDMKM